MAVVVKLDDRLPHAPRDLDLRQMRRYPNLLGASLRVTRVL